MRKMPILTYSNLFGRHINSFPLTEGCPPPPPPPNYCGTKFTKTPHIMNNCLQYRSQSIIELDMLMLMLMLMLMMPLINYLLLTACGLLCAYLKIRILSYICGPCKPESYKEMASYFSNCIE